MLTQQTPRRSSAPTEAIHVDNITFDPKVHTFQRLLDQVESVLRDARQPLLIGSLGRAAVLGSDREFHLRRETVTRKRFGLARDIDLFIPDGGFLALPTAPFPVDTTAISAHDQRVVVDNGQYWLVDELLGLSMPVDADAFAPETWRLFGELDVRTFSPQTHYALLFVIFEAAHKYATVRRMMRNHVPDLEGMQRSSLYAPFFEFYERRRTSLLNLGRCAYRRVIPRPLRYSLHPLVGRLTHRR